MTRPATEARIQPGDSSDHARVVVTRGGRSHTLLMPWGELYGLWHEHRHALPCVLFDAAEERLKPGVRTLLGVPFVAGTVPPSGVWEFGSWKAHSSQSPTS